MRGKSFFQKQNEISPNLFQVIHKQTEHINRVKKSIKTNDLDFSMSEQIENPKVISG